MIIFNNQRTPDNIRFLLHDSSVVSVRAIHVFDHMKFSLNKRLTLCCILCFYKTADPRISTLQILANYFDVTLDALYENTELHNNTATQKGKSIPIVSWTDVIKYRSAIKNTALNNWEQWVMISDHCSENMFALKSKASMEPRFPRGTIFIVDAKLIPRDGDLVVVHYPETKECTLRELSIDGRTELLLPLNANSKSDRLIKSIKLIGVVVQSRFCYQSEINF